MEEEEEEEEETHLVAMSNLALLKRWRILPCHLELASRRVKWLQAMIANPRANVQAVAAIFGPVCVEGNGWSRTASALDGKGKPMAHNPGKLAAAFDEALKYYEDVSGAESFFAAWDAVGRSWKALLVSKPLRRELLALDAKLLVAAFACDVLDHVCGSAEIGEDKVNLHVCQLRNLEGAACGATFTNTSQLISHQTNYHCIPQPITSCVATNCCPVCYTSFATKLCWNTRS